MPFNNAMNTMLPTQNGTATHVTGNYGENRGSSGPHGGTDFNYQGQCQQSRRLFQEKYVIKLRY